MANVFSRIAETLFFGYICWLWQRSIDYPVWFFSRRSADNPIFSRLKVWLWDLLSRVNLTDVFIRDPVNSLPSVGSLWGNEKKQRNRYPTCTWIFPPRKANRSSFFLVKKHFPNENQLVLDHLCFPPLEIVCSCVLLSSPWSEVISPLLRMGHETNLIQASR